MTALKLNWENNDEAVVWATAVHGNLSSNLQKLMRHFAGNLKCTDIQILDIFDL